MPPRTRRTAHQENITTASAHAKLPAPIAKEKHEAPQDAASRPSRVLQDITTKFVAPESPGPLLESSKQVLPKEQPQPRPRLKRKAKAPIGHLAKRRALKIVSTHPAIPSSLPPSSPPSESSRFEVVHDGGFTGRHPFILEDDAKNSKYGERYSDENENSFTEQWNDDVDNNERLDFNTGQASTNTADPFGFLTVESKLKAQRQAKLQPSTLHARPAVGGQELVLSELDIPVDDDHPTPYPDTVEDDYDENIPPHIPSTPHKKRKKRKSTSSPSLSSTELFSPRSESIPSTPSPSKFRASNVAQNATDMSDGDLTMTKVPPKVTEDVKAGDKAKGGKKRGSQKKARISDDSISPRTLAKSLESLLPKRKSRSRTASSKAKGKTKKVIDETEDEDDERMPQKPKKRATTSRKPRSATTGKGKASANAANDEESIDIDSIDEKLKQERQARLEYFKKLESYKVEEENVYVV